MTTRIQAACACLVVLLAQGCDSGARTVRNEPPGSEPPPAPQPPTSGLDARPSNTSCLAWEQTQPDGAISLARYTNLAFVTPIAMLQAPADNDRWFVVEQGGIVQQFEAANPAIATPFIDISDRVRTGGEMGLLGMAFHPGFPTDPRVFLSYTTGTAPLVSRVSSFQTNDGGATLDASTETVLLTVEQPETNHNGGQIAFGPDGYLYLGLGDGGGAGDDHGTIGNGQRLTTLLGKMLRIDIDSAAPYAIPPDNPFAGAATCPAAGRTSSNCPEIYAWGFRNPWRWSFDRGTGELWVGDVGQGAWEEVSVVERGGNYGWRCREGAHDFNTDSCPAGGLIDPVVEYPRDPGNAVTGGYVYRGAQTTPLAGRYIFGDFGSGRIWAWLPQRASQPREPTLLLTTPHNISSFAEGNDGELYVVDYGGTLHHIEFQPSSGGGTAPEMLSATGCVDAADPTQPAAGLIPYDIHAPFWSDGAAKQRWIGLPDGQSIAVQADGDWDFPDRTVLMKHFRLDDRLIETRLFMRHPGGAWGGFSYEWNAAQTDATLVRGGAVRDIGNGRSWIFPSESECLDCHTAAAGRSLGLETSQLNRDFTYPQTARTANQLATLSAIEVLSPPVDDPTAQSALPDLADASAPVAERARAYLHTNCAQCHRPNGPTPSTMDLRYATSFAATDTCGVMPQSGDLGLGPAARLIAPGSAANSLVVARANRRDAHGMPPVGSDLIDDSGVALLTQWIDGLEGC